MWSWWVYGFSCRYDRWVGRQLSYRGGFSCGNEEQFLTHTERPQMLHENESTEADRCFLLSFFARIAAILLTSKSFVPCVHWYAQRPLSWAVASQEFTSMLQLLRFTFRVSLYLLKGPPWSRCPSFSCPYSSIFGILSSSIRTMSPVHLSWQLMIKHSMLGRPRFSRTWRLDTLSFHLMLQIFRRHRWWKCSSCWMCRR